MRLAIFAVFAALALMPFWAPPALQCAYGMSRPAAWFHVASTLAIVWIPLWLVVGLIVSKRA